MDQRLFRRTEFQSDRSRDAGPGQAAEYQVQLTAAHSLAQQRAEAAGNANVLPRQPSRLGSSDWLNRPLAS
ncbi:hypothetical protein PBY51_000244 [Eleginops maclovinus]|uniref:Uncharacterized protein n=1 Tax=Eleginops maclovinus TaxID=56733 RepID=A0AAN7XLX4_ELEMC|nr:hypothetical protein PBY51_000244 [Eleginops maclovinus]